MCLANESVSVLEPSWREKVMSSVCSQISNSKMLFQSHWELVAIVNSCLEKFAQFLYTQRHPTAVPASAWICQDTLCWGPFGNPQGIPLNGKQTLYEKSVLFSFKTGMCTGGPLLLALSLHVQPWVSAICEQYNLFTCLQKTNCAVGPQLWYCKCCLKNDVVCFWPEFWEVFS